MSDVSSIHRSSSVSRQRALAVFRGRVLRGEGLGRSIGYPTANLSPSLLRTRRVRDGVYAALASIGRKRYDGVAVVGVRSRQGVRKLEVHIFGLRKTLNGRTLTLTMLKRLRPIRTFSSRAALVRAIRSDIRRAKRFFARRRPLLPS